MKTKFKDLQSLIQNNNDSVFEDVLSLMSYWRMGACDNSNWCSSVRIDLNYDRNKHLCHCFTNGAMVHSFTGSACCLLTGRLAEASEEHDHKFIYLFLLLEISDESSPPPFKLASDATGNYIHKFARYIIFDFLNSNWWTFIIQMCYLNIIN